MLQSSQELLRVQYTCIRPCTALSVLIDVNKLL